MCLKHDAKQGGRESINKYFFCVFFYFVEDLPSILTCLVAVVLGKQRFFYFVENLPPLRFVQCGLVPLILYNLN